MLVKTIKLDCEGFEDLARKQNIKIDSREEIDSNTYKYAFTRADGTKGWAIETGAMYDADAYYTEIKIYDGPEIK